MKRLDLAACNRIILMPPNWLGDVVMAQPALSACARANPEAEIIIHGRPWLKDLIPFLNLGDHVHYQAALEEAADAIVVFPNSIRSAWQAFRSGTPQRAGFKKEARGILLTHAYRPNVDVMTEHHRDYFIDLVEQMGLSVEQREVEMNCPKQELAAGRELMHQHGLDADRVICVAPGAHFGGAKRYPSESYAYILDWLAEAGWQPLILGTANEREIGDHCLTRLGEAPCWNAAGETSMQQALQLVSACRLMLCNDSGMMHVAAGMGRPTIGIFGATLPDRTAPSGPHTKVFYEPATCSPCLQRECSTPGHPCMGNVLPEMVRNSCLEMLSP